MPPLSFLTKPQALLTATPSIKIELALEHLMKDHTCLIITHRFSVVDNVDRIVALQNGLIVEQGTPSELMAKGGVYAEFKRLQQIQR